MNGRDGTTAFLPLNSKIGGQINHDRPSVGQFLTREQANYIYKKVESGETINIDTIQQDMEQDEQLDKIDDMSGKTNPYKKLIVNNTGKIEPLMTQMEQWSILINILNDIQHGRNPVIDQNLSIRVVNKYKGNSKAEEERENTELDFGVTPQILHEEYLDVDEGIQSEIESTTRFDENSDLSTTDLGRSDKTRNTILKVEVSFPILGHGYISGRLLDGTECQLLLYTGVSKLFMSKSFYM